MRTPSLTAFRAAEEVFKETLKEIQKGNNNSEGVIDIYDIANKAERFLTADKVKRIIAAEFMDVLHVKDTLIVNFPNKVVYTLSNWRRNNKGPVTTSVIHNSELIVSLSSTRATSFHRAVDDGMVELIVQLMHGKQV